MFSNQLKKMGVLGFHFISMLEKVVAFVATCTDSRIAKALIEEKQLPIIKSSQVQSLVLAGEGPLDCRSSNHQVGRPRENGMSPMKIFETLRLGKPSTIIYTWTMKKLLQRAMLYEVPIIGSIARNQLVEPRNSIPRQLPYLRHLEARQSESHQFISSLVSSHLGVHPEIIGVSYKPLYHT